MIQGIPQTIVERLPTQRFEVPLTKGLALPIFEAPDPSIKYPIINVPTQEEFDAAVRAEKQKEKEEKEEKSRGLPDATPTLQLPPVVQTPQDNRIISDDVLKNNNLGVPVIEVPIVGEVPIPPKEQVLLAGTTATASVAAAIVGKSMVEWMVKKMKPIVQQIFVRGKKLLNRDLTPYELQTYFAFEKSQSLKKVNKLLKKEHNNEKKEQYNNFHSK
ncbi:hypothetical protein [Synechococcus phage DSL-LC03]|nr:hypothetical protein [Synechococcus phage DSL-LC03]